MKRIIIMGLMLIATGAQAQWSTNYWPAWSYPRKGNSQLSQVYSGLVERADACGAAHISGVTWWRLDHDLVDAYKDYIKDTLLTGNWVPRTNFSGTTYIGSVNPVYYVNVTNLCEMARLPTNFFDYTPWRLLSGLGPFTNDTTVGHGYGYTNEYTAAGGTNFPAGRTNWYTTDYGIDGLTNAIAQLKMRSGDTYFHSVETNVLGSPTFYSYGIGVSALLDDMESDWNTAGNWAASSLSNSYYHSLAAPKQGYYCLQATALDAPVTNYAIHGSSRTQGQGHFGFAGSVGSYTGTITAVSFYANWFLYNMGSETNEALFNYFSWDDSRKNTTSLWETVTNPVISSGWVNSSLIWNDTITLPRSGTVSPDPEDWPRQVFDPEMTMIVYDFVWE